MFKKIFSYPAVLQRHLEGPLTSERLAYLQYLNDRGVASGTLLRQARYCLCIAREIQRGPESIASMLPTLRPSPLLGQRDAWHKDGLPLLAGRRNTFAPLLAAFWKGLAAWRTIRIHHPAAMMRGLKISSRQSARDGGWRWPRARSDTGSSGVSSSTWTNRGIRSNASPPHTSTLISTTSAKRGVAFP